MRFCAKLARRDSLRLAFAVLLTLSLSGTLALSQETTLRSQSNVVLVPAMVKDADGGIVYGLQASDFLVEDNGVEQSVRLDEAPEGQPISLVVVVQRGRRAAAEFPRIQGLRTMLDPLFSLGTARVAVLEFDSHVEAIRNFTTDSSLVEDDLRNLQPGDEGAVILDAVKSAVNLLNQEPPERLRVLLLISETRDHGSRTKIADAVAAIGQSNALMYALAFSPALSNILDTGRGTNLNEMHEGINFLDLMYQVSQAMRKNVPSTIASMTGGEYELFATRKKFEVRMNDFTNHLHSRYLLSFAPKNPQPGLHQIRVRLRPQSQNAADVTVLARTSYWAEATTQ
ncbi:MAG TPA: VWA domain-containing protein [Candidatus Sulfotelmatobacter sp.]|nr:VWA domain-containing protein [Candidatus Sulfotelmatobacter sp.]